MDIQLEKLRLIEQLARVQDHRIIEQIREILKNTEKLVHYDSTGASLTKEDFIKRIEESEKEFHGGLFSSIDDVERESEKW
jgi:hypothetical protein